MIAKGVNGSGFLGVIKYNLDPAKYPEIIHANNVIESDKVSVLTANFVQVADANSKVEKPVWHFSLSFSPEDRHRLNKEFLSEISQSFASRMGISDNQYLVIEHNDTLHPHVHIIANRVGFDGKCQADKMMKKRAMEASQSIEKEYGLIKAKDKSRAVAFSNRPLKYAFNPSDSQLTSDLKSRVRKILNPGVISRKDVERSLSQCGITLTEKATQNNENWSALEVSYEYFDNQSKEYKTGSRSIGRGAINKLLNDNELEDFLSTNLANSRKDLNEVKHIIDQEANRYLKEEIDIDKLLLAIYLNRIDTNNSSIVKYIISKGRDEIQSELIKDKLSNAFFGGLQLKREVFEGKTPVFTKDTVFFFSKRDIELIGEDNVDRFYDSFCKSQQIENPILQKFIKSKRLSSDTIYYILNRHSGQERNYADLKVNYEQANTALKVMQSDVSITPEERYRQELMTSIRVFNSGMEKEEEIIEFLAKRGVKLQKQNSNIYLMRNDVNMGLASVYGLESLKRHGPITRSTSNNQMEQAFDRHFDEKSSAVYRLLDQNKLKSASSFIKSNSFKFKLSESDIKFYSQSFIPIIERTLSTASARSTSNYNKRSRHGKKR